jgi:hypothetical protein
MTAALVALALVAAGLGVTAAGLGIRISGLKERILDARALAVANGVAAHDFELAMLQAKEELRQLQVRSAAIEARHRTELDHLSEVAARCADPAEIRRQLQLILTPRKS